MRKSPVNSALRAPRLTYGVETKALGLIWGPMAFVAVIIGTNISWVYAVIPMVGAAIRYKANQRHKGTLKRRVIFRLHAARSVVPTNPLQRPLA